MSECVVDFRGIAIRPRSEDSEGSSPPTNSDAANSEEHYMNNSDYLSRSGLYCEKLVSTLLHVPMVMLRAPTRQGADVAFARQVAMYLAHTKFRLPLTDVGVYFGRDRTTVAHACHLIEDRRDNSEFDAQLSAIEELIDHAMRPRAPLIEGQTTQAWCA
ncbi:MAG: helix-turn-helix domain-containing protein [Pseudomonadota bacterium]